MPNTVECWTVRSESGSFTMIGRSTGNTESQKPAFLTRICGSSPGDSSSTCKDPTSQRFLISTLSKNAYSCSNVPWRPEQLPHYSLVQISDLVRSLSFLDMKGSFDRKRRPLCQPNRRSAKIEECNHEFAVTASRLRSSATPSGCTIGSLSAFAPSKISSPSAVLPPEKGRRC